MRITCEVDDDGQIHFRDADGKEASDEVIAATKKQNKDAILQLITQKCDEINEQLLVLDRLHHETSDPSVPPRFEQPEFPQQPLPPTPRRLGLLGRLLPPLKRRTAEFNALQEASYSRALAAWADAKKTFDAECASRRHHLEHGIYSDLEAMETFLDESLSDIAWPRETIVAFDIQDGGKTVLLDVDLPEIEDMPTRLASIPARGMKLSVKEMSATKVQKLYMDHIHSVLLRLIGETFAALPTVQQVVASGFSQRRDPGTGALRDDYLLSVRVPRSAWLTLDFNALHAVDPVEALARFELLRTMTKTGVFKPIAPFEQ